jgi:renalase
LNKHLVIGAGISGLTLANRLKAPIIEKSRGVGGRMATRRIQEERFDHGNPCWPECLRCQDLHRGCFVPEGMTAIAKRLATPLQIHFETRALKLVQIPKGWKVLTDKGEFETEELILTAPLPQSLDLLEASGIKVLDSWRISYHKALVGLYSFSHVNPDQQDILKEHQIYFMKNRNLASNGASFYLSPARSEEMFDLADEEILAKMTQLLWSIFPKQDLKHSELKRWRYSTPETSHNYPYLKVAPGLTLCGDGFLYPGIEGALASSESLLRDYFKVI